MYGEPYMNFQAFYLKTIIVSYTDKSEKRQTFKIPINNTSFHIFIKTIAFVVKIA